MSDIVKRTMEIAPTDGFAIIDEGPPSGGAPYLRFDAAKPPPYWYGREGQAAFLGPLMVVDVRKEIVKWIDQMVADRIIEEAGKPLPDVDDLNAKCPQSEWGVDFSGNPRGPYQLAWTVFFVNPLTGEKCIASNGTIGTRIAWEQLKERTQFMRKFRGENVFPKVMLSSKAMKTRFGVKMRPDFEIVEWATLGGPSDAPAVNPPSRTPPKLSPAEVIDDEIPDHGHSPIPETPQWEGPAMDLKMKTRGPSCRSSS